MEPAKIDWKTIDSKFVKDDLYENINAPKWVDFSASEEPVDDEAWFCKPDCKHPKRVEDFLKSTPTSKLLGFRNVCEVLPLGDRNRRDGNLKRRGLAQSSVSSNNDSKFNEDSENQNPNFSPPPNHQVKSMKAAIKSSMESKKLVDNSMNSMQNDDRPRLKSTLSSRNLFAGRDILNQITDFCNELKKMATRPKERENVEKLSVKKSPMGVKELVKEVNGDDLGDLDGREKEIKPLLDVGKEKSEANEKSNGKAKQRRKKRADDAENNPVSVEIKNIRHNEGESLLQIRTNPPSPQCFSAAARGPTKSTPNKPSRSRFMERGILQEVEQSNKEEVRKGEEPGDKGNNGISVSIVAEKEARTLDVFWFLKPCTLAS